MKYHLCSVLFWYQIIDTVVSYKKVIIISRTITLSLYSPMFWLKKKEKRQWLSYGKRSYPMFTKHKCFQTKVFENFLSKRREGETIATSKLYIPSTITLYRHNKLLQLQLILTIKFTLTPKSTLSKQN